VEHLGIKGPRSLSGCITHTRRSRDITRVGSDLLGHLHHRSVSSQCLHEIPPGMAQSAQRVPSSVRQLLRVLSRAR
jgi:hypothetical protein